MRVNLSEVVQAMSFEPRYETYEYTARGPRVRAQSIVECRLADWSSNRVLAVQPSVVFGGAEVSSGEVRYGGRLFLSVVAATPEGALIAAERGAEFSHRAECAEAAPAQEADVVLRVEKTEVRADGRALVLSAIVTAEIDLYVPAQLRRLTGGEGVVCRPASLRVQRRAACVGAVSVEEEFDTDYVGDVLLHSEQVLLTRVACSAGCLEVSGEVNLGVLSRREEGEPVSYERLIPFSAEIPCDEASAGLPCEARAGLLSVSLTASCDEEKGRCRILARIEAEVRGAVYLREELACADDAFLPGMRAELSRGQLETEEPLCSFTANERVCGIAALNGQIDFSCALQAAGLCSVEAAASVSDGEVTVDGVLSAVLFCREGEAERGVPVSLPFSFPVRCDRARAGAEARVSALCCGVSVRQKKEGEAEVEGSVRLFVTLLSRERFAYIAEVAAGEPLPAPGGAVGIYFPAAGDTLWDTAKKLGCTPAQVQATQPSLTFPLTGAERIVVYRGGKAAES